MKQSKKMASLTKIILLTCVFLLSGIACVKSQSDSICLTDKEYNDLLVKGNCSEIIWADSVMLDDRSKTISLLYEKVQQTNRVNMDNENIIKNNKTALDTQLKANKRIKFIAGLVIVLEAVGIGWAVSHH